MMSPRVFAVALAMATLLPVAGLRAQDATATRDAASATPTGGTVSGLAFSASPYLWIAGISGSIRTPFQQAVPTREVNVSFGDTLSNLSGFAFMGAAELRYGRFALLGDIMTLRVDSDVTTRGLFFAGGKGRVTTTMGSVLGAFRLYEGEFGALDIGAGVRPWSIDTRLSLNAALLPAVTLRPSKSWTDPVLALRYRYSFNDRWSVSFYGDVGGFGAGSDLTWQVLGTVDYRIGQMATMRLGYRHMQIENRRLGTDFALGLSGPILAATLRF